MEPLSPEAAAYIAAALRMAARMIPPGTAGNFRGEYTDAGDVMRNALAALEGGKE